VVVLVEEVVDMHLVAGLELGVQEQMVVLVVVGDVDMLMVEDLEQETHRQYHHHKEIVEQLEILVELVMVEEVEVLVVVHPVLDPVVLEREHHHLLLDYQ